MTHQTTKMCQKDNLFSNNILIILKTKIKINIYIYILNKKEKKNQGGGLIKKKNYLFLG